VNFYVSLSLHFSVFWSTELSKMASL